jgi:hypothetical protein
MALEKNPDPAIDVGFLTGQSQFASFLNAAQGGFSVFQVHWFTPLD